jgi:hypothetical protein
MYPNPGGGSSSPFSWSWDSGRPAGSTGPNSSLPAAPAGNGTTGKNGQPAGWNTVGNGASDYTTYDPYGTGAGAASALGGMSFNGPGTTGNYAGGSYTGARTFGDLGIQGPTAVTNPGYDTNAYWQQTMGQQGAINDFVGQQMGQYRTDMSNLANLQSTEAGRNIAGQFAGAGGARSGAAAAAMAQGMATPYAQANAQLAQQQGQMASGLLNNAMGLNAGQQQTAGQLGLGYRSLQSQQELGWANTQADIGSRLALGAGQQDLGWGQLGEQARQFDSNYGQQGWNMANQARLGAAQTGFGATTYVAPTYGYNPTPWESFMGAAPTAISAASTAASVAGKG